MFARQQKTIAATFVLTALIVSACALTPAPAPATVAPAATPIATFGATPSAAPATVAPAATPIATFGATPSATEQEFFKISSLGATLNGATKPTTFTITTSWLVTEIISYHWNNGQGKTPGTVGLRAADGTTYGPWQATGQPGQGGVPNAYWVVRPNTVIVPGTYTVLDSDPSTWSQNQETGGAGMSWGKGIHPRTETPAGAITPEGAGPEEAMFQVRSDGRADSGPIAPTTFGIIEPWNVTEITTYHWNSGRGAMPGTIGLRAQDGTAYGPWSASGLPGQGGVANAYWVVKPNVVIPSGTYSVVDSDPGTWAQNSETLGKGMAWGKGIRPRTGTPVPDLPVTKQSPMATASKTPSVPPLVKPLADPVVSGSIQIQEGRSAMGGYAGDTIQASVTYTATSRVASVTEMRSVRGCLAGPLQEAPWEPFVRQKSFPVYVMLNWSGFSVSVQYRDARGNLSPDYCDDINVEGMPRPPN